MTLIRRNNTFNPLNILLQIPVPWVFILNYLLGLLLQVLLPFSIIPQTAVFFIKITGYILFATGVFLATWSLLIFRKARTTTTPGERSKILIVKGPYRFTRNPMYVSLILAYLGEAGFLAQIWPVLVLPLTLLYVNLVVIPLEEEILRVDFPEEYAGYCRRVNRWF